ncbi:nitrate reductase subunit alpha [Pilimelia terevasa]|uniref:Nitrate reductase subunit alpha n=1 Tax=Pilimelia terevasa TaxID=53372 RepID=A0A8J3BNC7_9ACTN|nr:nitrate reductase subunit alpha [Pilimelia terevasa]GGK23496.1 nitrate reductase subunit alpha [Pilimelia terevasa]
MTVAAERAGRALLAVGGLLRRAHVSPDRHRLHRVGGRRADDAYRDHPDRDHLDRDGAAPATVVRTTHGVDCTGSCAWAVHVRDGIITWEQPDSDYPAAGPDRPDHEPRGCPRGAAFAWYSYSPTRIRYPYARAALVRPYREARARLGDPVAAWAELQADPGRRAAYQAARGRGALVRIDWAEAEELIAAAHVHTIAAHGPDRIVGYSPAPAASMVSHAVGARFLSLLGGVLLSASDSRGDQPVAAPQVYGDRPDPPESADWWDATYVLLWGADPFVTRTPDAHFLAEARYRGQKVVAVTPGHADSVTGADEWLSVRPGTDAALAMAMGHVVLREFFVDRPTPRFDDYVRRYTDLPYLVALEPTGDGAFTPGRFLTAADLDGGGDLHTRFRPLVWDGERDAAAAPAGSLGDRFTDEPGSWHLDPGGTPPRLSCAGGEPTEVALARFDTGAPGTLRRGVPAVVVAGRLATTVFDLMLAQYGVGRPGLPGDWPAGYADARTPYTPAWQEPLTGVPAAVAARVAREFAANAAASGGRSMILTGGGTQRWFHGDTIARATLALTMLTGCQGVNGGGWAYYGGQQRCRTGTGWAHLAFGLDWARPARQANGTAFWYLHADQWRYDRHDAGALASPLGAGRLAGRHTADLLAQAVRLGWLPDAPTFDRNPLDVADEALAADPADPAGYVARALTAGTLRFAGTDPDAPGNWPRILTVWRGNPLGAEPIGEAYVLRHLLGTDAAPRAAEAAAAQRPRDVAWHADAPRGKLDLLVAMDFRATSTTLHADVVLPAATWYEKHDLNTTDLHPFVHALTAAVPPPWQCRTDVAAFHGIARAFSALAATRLGVRRDLVAAPLHRDSPDCLATPGGRVRDWQGGRVRAVPGLTLPAFTVVTRDYGAVAAQLAALGPLLDTHGTTTGGVTVDVTPEIDLLRARNGAVAAGPAAGRPRLDTDAACAEAVLALSGATNGRIAAAGYAALEQRTGRRLADLADPAAAIRFADVQARSVPALATFESAGGGPGRVYAPFTTHVERHTPWPTLTGRQHFFLDHDWLTELGEQLPIYRPPLDLHLLRGEPPLGAGGEGELTVRYLTPRSPWSVRSTGHDLPALTQLSGGWPTLWLAAADAARIGVADGDWVEAVNRHGVLVARAAVTGRLPPGSVYAPAGQERTAGAPRAQVSGRRGAAPESPTRLMLKPTHFVGGYAQLAYGFDYLGPTAAPADEIAVVRRRPQRVEY